MSRVEHRLAARKLHLVRGQRQEAAAELNDRGCERDPCARRRLAEDEAERLLREQRLRIRLQLVGEVEHRLELLPRKITAAEEVAPPQAYVRFHAPRSFAARPAAAPSPSRGCAFGASNVPARTCAAI